MAILWLPLGWVSYVKNPERDLPNMMPLFQIFNGWFGVILFLALGMWSKRFKIALNAQAEEKKRMMGGAEGDTEPLGSPEDTHSLNSGGGGSRPGSAVATPSEDAPVEDSGAPLPASRPATAGATGTSRPTSAAQPPPEADEPDEPPVEEDALP